MGTTACVGRIANPTYANVLFTPRNPKEPNKQTAQPYTCFQLDDLQSTSVGGMAFKCVPVFLTISALRGH